MRRHETYFKHLCIKKNTSQQELFSQTRTQTTQLIVNMFSKDSYLSDVLKQNLKSYQQVNKITVE